tara:strand:+ start:204 stop:407 length:204 start_codon:yes stop_codon:yes gene_type:complete
VATGLAAAESLPEDTIDFMLGGVFGPDGPRAVSNLDVNIGRDVLAFASGEFANTKDWAATAGLKIRW